MLGGEVMFIKIFISAFLVALGFTKGRHEDQSFMNRGACVQNYYFMLPSTQSLKVDRMFTECPTPRHYRTPRYYRTPRQK